MANCWDPADEEKARIKWKEIRPGEEPTDDDLAPILGNRWNWANPTHMEAARQAWQAELPDREPLDDKAAAALGKKLDWAEIWHEIFKGDETVRLERISKVVRDFAAELDKDDPQPDSLQESEPSSLLAIEPAADSTPVKMQEADVKEAQWLSLCHLEEKNRIDIDVALRDSPPDPNSPSDPELQAVLRRWWASVEALLKFYTEEVCLRAPPGDLPFALVNAIKRFAGYLAIGQIPGPIAGVVGRGAHPPGPQEEQDIGVAVAYLMAANRDLEHFGELIVVDDRYPVKTVSEALGVDRTTVQRWRKNFRPGGLGMNPINAEILKNLMIRAGKSYRFAGRSPWAIRNRC